MPKSLNVSTDEVASYKIFHLEDSDRYIYLTTWLYGYKHLITET